MLYRCSFFPIDLVFFEMRINLVISVRCRVCSPCVECMMQKPSRYYCAPVMIIRSVSTTCHRKLILNILVLNSCAFSLINLKVFILFWFSFLERGRIYSKQEVRSIQIGPGGLFFTGDGTGEVRVWKWLTEATSNAWVAYHETQDNLTELPLFIISGDWHVSDYSFFCGKINDQSYQNLTEVLISRCRRAIAFLRILK